MDKKGLVIILIIILSCIPVIPVQGAITYVYQAYDLTYNADDCQYIIDTQDYADGYSDLYIESGSYNSYVGLLYRSVDFTENSTHKIDSVWLNHSIGTMMLEADDGLTVKYEMITGSQIFGFSASNWNDYHTSYTKKYKSVSNNYFENDDLYSVTNKMVRLYTGSEIDTSYTGNVELVLTSDYRLSSKGIRSKESGAGAQLLVRYRVNTGETYVGTVDGYTIYTYTTSAGLDDVMFTDMYLDSNSVKFTSIQDYYLSTSTINKNTLDVAIGYPSSLVGSATFDTLTYEFNMSVVVGSHSATQKDFASIMNFHTKSQASDINDEFALNNQTVCEIRSNDATTYQLLTRIYGTGSKTGTTSALLTENVNYTFRATFSPTEFKVSVFNSSGIEITDSHLTPTYSYDMTWIQPFCSIGSGTAGSQGTFKIWKGEITVSGTYFIAYPSDDVGGSPIDGYTDLDELIDYIINENAGQPIYYTESRYFEIFSFFALIGFFAGIPLMPWAFRKYGIHYVGLILVWEMVCLALIQGAIV